MEKRDEMMLTNVKSNARINIGLSLNKSNLLFLKNSAKINASRIKTAI